MKKVEKLAGNRAKDKSLLTVKRTVNPRSLQNLKPYKPGESGNPKGRPPDILTDAYKELLPEAVPGDAEGKNWAQQIALAQFRAAAAGSTQAAKEIADRTQGKAPQNLIIHESDSTDPVDDIRELIARGRDRLAKQGMAESGSPADR